MAAYTGRPGVDWGAVAQAVALEKGIQEYLEDQKAQAVRWQGQQDYQTLIDSGIAPVEALKRTAPKIFYNDPRGLASAVESTSRGMLTPEGEPITKTLEDGSMAVWTGRSWHVVAKRPEGREAFVDVTTTLPTGEKETRRVPVAQREAEKRTSELEAAAAQYQSAQKELGTWAKRLGLGAGPYREQMAASSNVLASAGIDPRTMQPFPTNLPPATIAQAVLPPATGPVTAPPVPTVPATSMKEPPRDGRVYPTPKGPAYWDREKSKWITLPEGSSKLYSAPATLPWGMGGIKG